VQPKSSYDVRALALYAPKIAFGLVAGVPRVPFLDDIPIIFSSSTVNAPPVVGTFQNNLSQDALIERVTYNLFQQNSFPGSPFQSLYFNQLKQSGQTGVGIKLDVYGGPKYDTANSDTFIDLGNYFDVFAATWPEGWPLYKQSNVKLSAILTQTPVSVPYNIEVTFTGFQFLDKVLDDMSDADARCRLRALGIESPDLELLLRQP
jgi:hypothetical protein